MIKMLTASTRRVDDAKAAVEEVLERLDLPKRRLENSLGIFAYHPDFADSGVVEALAAALPFDTIGETTSSSAIDGASGDEILTVSVLTSDDVFFRAGMSRAITKDSSVPARELYSRIVPPEMGRPSLLLAFAPLIENVGGDEIVATIDELSGGVPLFGALAASPHLDFSRVETFANGKRSANGLVIAAIFGKVAPRFYVTTIPEDRTVRGLALITQAERNRIERINGFVPINYLERIGLAENGRFISDIIYSPFVLTLKDGSQVVRAAYKVTDEGDILTYSNVPRGARASFSEINADFVIQSTKETIARVVSESNAENALIVSCGGRRLVLGERKDAEMKEIAGDIGHLLSYQFVYSLGEICPVKNNQGQKANNFHNYTLIVCAF
jgi:hypothetical protein